ncbi:GTP-binding protein [Paenibacillus sp. IB182496]|uniref:GTP-binding protein n=1 Tax=Paenibacillus sabuli TaxID=2772509 RepID=A0A927BNC6_9BACL|nr:GTP-binding protein [Paenibacillus sabuli]MBD2843718.1 GTP-binding protein [Paenibacillus sabuli]
MTSEHHQAAAPAIPVHILSGFLGSGKTTLLMRVLEQYRAEGVRAAVIMNELGEVNLDGQLVGAQVPMQELLGGCICCSIRGDLGLALTRLVESEQPDVIVIESTGAANPLEIIDGVTETAMVARIELQSVTVVVDGPGLLELRRRGGASLRLMREQVRCATGLLVNKADRLDPERLVEVQQLVREWNPLAALVVTEHCQVEPGLFLRRGPVAPPRAAEPSAAEPPAGQAPIHPTHDHVMAHTHYFRAPVDSEAFEALLAGLPERVFRAKGIVTFRDTPSRFLFQYAFRESDFMRIDPQGEVHDVAVFIGEHFSREALIEQLEALERIAAAEGKS